MVSVACYSLLLSLSLSADARPAGSNRPESVAPVASAKERETSARVDPTYAASQRKLLPLYVDLGRDAAAIRIARQALTTNPADADTAHTLARLLMTLHRHTEAAKVLGDVLESPNLATSPRKKLDLLLDRARCQSLLRSQAAEAWEQVTTFLSREQAALIRDGLAQSDWQRLRLESTEQLGLAQEQGRRWPEAVASFRKMEQLAADPKNTDVTAATRVHWRLANLHFHNSEWNEALTEMERFLRSAPTDAHPFLRYAVILRKLGRDREVVPRLQRYQKPPANSTLLDWVIAAERVRSREDLGHAEFVKLMDSTADHEKIRLMVDAYADAGRARDVCAMLNRLFPAEEPRKQDSKNMKPNDAMKRQALAQAIVDRSDLAFQLCGMLAQEPQLLTQSEAWEILGWAAERLGRPDHAEMAYKAALFRAEGNSIRPLLRLRAHYLMHRQWDSAVELIDSYRRHLPEGYLIYLKLAPLAELGQQLSDQETDRAAGETRFGTLREKARVLGILGQYRRMKLACEAMLNEFERPEEVRSIRLLLSDAYHGLREFDKAEKELRALIEDDPEDPLPLNNLGYNLADQNRKLPDAEAMIRRAIELDREERIRNGEITAESGIYLDSLGWVLFRRGKLEEARTLLEQASRMPESATDAVVWDHLGDVCFRLGQTIPARKAWTFAVERYRGSHVGRQNGRLEEARRKLKQTD